MRTTIIGIAFLLSGLTLDPKVLTCSHVDLAAVSQALEQKGAVEPIQYVKRLGLIHLRRQLTIGNVEYSIYYINQQDPEFIEKHKQMTFFGVCEEKGVAYSVFIRSKTLPLYTEPDNNKSDFKDTS